MKITALMICFNQEKYVEKALKSLLNQNIEPSRYQIVISDDNSTDKTFGIVNDLVNNYNGPFDILTNQNVENLGLIEHVNFVFNNFVTSEFVLFQAGDDVSLSNRATIALDHLMTNKKIKLLASDAMKIDSNGNEIGNYVKSQNKTYYQRSTSELIKLGNMHYGASICMASEVFFKFGDLDPRIVSEDEAFALRASMIGKIDLLDQVLIQYRIHDSNMTEWNHPKNIVSERMRHYSKMLHRKINHMEHLKKLINNQNDSQSLTALLIKELEVLKLKGRLISNNNLALRVHFLISKIQYSNFKIVLLAISPRLFFLILAKMR